MDSAAGKEAGQTLLMCCSCDKPQEGIEYAPSDIADQTLQVEKHREDQHHAD